MKKAKKIKKITITVDFLVELEADIEPDAVTFAIPLSRMIPQDHERSGRKRVGHVRSYTTQSYVGEDP